MEKIYCDDSENVLRALYEAEVDRNRVHHKSLEEKKNLSVSRLKIHTQFEIFSIFHRDLGQKSPIVAALELNAGYIRETSERLFQSNKANIGKPPLRVREDPLVNNPAHAEIEGKITGSLAKELTRHCKICKESALTRIYRAARKMIS